MRKKTPILIVLFLLNSCFGNEDLINSTFTENEIKTTNQIISFYDDFVYSKTDKSLEIKTAYKAFLDKTIPLVYEQGDLRLITPEQSVHWDFFKSLGSNNLNVFYTIEDSVYYDQGKPIKRPPNFQLNYSGNYIQLLKKLSSRNDFFEKYYNSILIAYSGSGNPVSMQLILTDYDNIDFSKKEERLIFIIAMLENYTDNV
jgi:hypothetical protein